jgi:hypothetical protein
LLASMRGGRRRASEASECILSRIRIASADLRLGAAGVRFIRVSRMKRVGGVQDGRSGAMRRGILIQIRRGR